MNYSVLTAPAHTANALVLGGSAAAAAAAVTTSRSLYSTQRTAAAVSETKVTMITVRNVKGLILAENNNVQVEAKAKNFLHIVKTGPGSLEIEGKPILDERMITRSKSVYPLSGQGIRLDVSSIIASNSTITIKGTKATSTSLSLRLVQESKISIIENSDVVYDTLSATLSGGSCLQGDPSLVVSQMHVDFADQNNSVSCVNILYRLTCKTSSLNNSLSSVVTDRSARVICDPRVTTTDIRSVPQSNPAPARTPTPQQQQPLPPLFPYHGVGGMVIQAPPFVHPAPYHSFQIISSPMVRGAYVSASPVAYVSMRPEYVQPSGFGGGDAVNSNTNTATTKAKPGEDTCSVCLVNVPNTIMDPCMCKALCTDCVPAARRQLPGSRCPLCRTQVNSAIPLPSARTSTPSQ